MRLKHEPRRLVFLDKTELEKREEHLESWIAWAEKRPMRELKSHVKERHKNRVVKAKRELHQVRTMLRTKKRAESETG